MRRGSTLMLVVGLVLTGSVLTQCGGGGDMTTGTAGGCPNGICGPGTGSTSGNPTASSSNSGSGTGGTGGGSSCVEAWACTPWQTDGTNDNGTRVCTDKNACGT